MKEEINEICYINLCRKRIATEFTNKRKDHASSESGNKITEIIDASGNIFYINNGWSCKNKKIAKGIKYTVRQSEYYAGKASYLTTKTTLKISRRADLPLRVIITEFADWIGYDHHGLSSHENSDNIIEIRSRKLF